MWVGLAVTMKCVVKPQEGFSVYMQHHKHVSTNGGIFLAIKKLGQLFGTI